MASEALLGECPPRGGGSGGSGGEAVFACLPKEARAGRRAGEKQKRRGRVARPEQEGGRNSAGLGFPARRRRPVDSSLSPLNSLLHLLRLKPLQSDRNLCRGYGDCGKEAPRQDGSLSGVGGKAGEQAGREGRRKEREGKKRTATLFSFPFSLSFGFPSPFPPLNLVSSLSPPLPSPDITPTTSSMPL